MSIAEYRTCAVEGLRTAELARTEHLPGVTFGDESSSLGVIGRVFRQSPSGARFGGVQNSAQAVQRHP